MILKNKDETQLRRLFYTHTPVPQGVPYRRTFDQVMWRCVQAGLTSKWVSDLNKIYWKQVNNRKTDQQRLEDALKISSKRDDGLVRECRCI